MVQQDWEEERTPGLAGVEEEITPGQQEWEEEITPSLAGEGGRKNSWFSGSGRKKGKYLRQENKLFQSKQYDRFKL